VFPVAPLLLLPFLLGGQGGPRSTEIHGVQVLTCTRLFLLPFLLPAPFVVESWENQVIWGLVDVLALTLLFPSLFLEYVLIPLGATKWAWFWSRAFPPLGWGPDLRALAVLYAARACARRPRPDRIAWLRAPRRAPPQASTPHPVLRIGSLTALAAEAHLALLEGQPDRAMRLFEAAIHAPPRFRDGRARRLSRRWLIAHAATRGEWGRVLDLGRPHIPPVYGKRWWTRWHRRRTARVLDPFGSFAAAAAARIAGGARPHRVFLVLGWLNSPRRLATGWLLRAALRTPAVPPLALRGTKDALADALQVHEALLARATCHVGTADLVTVASAWDAVRDDPSVLPAIGRRVATLQARITPAEVLQRILTRASEEMDARILDLPDPVQRSLGRMRDDLPPGLARAVDAACTRLADRVQSAVAVLKRRTQDEGDLASADFWVEWETLRQDWERLVALDPSRSRGVYATAWSDTCNHAVHLHNVLGERLMAHAVFTFLARYAWEVEATANVDLLEKNARVSRN